MTKTIDAKITLSDEQYEALQVIYRLEAETVDDFMSMAAVGAMEAHLCGYIPGQPTYERLEAMIKS